MKDELMSYLSEKSIGDLMKDIILENEEDNKFPEWVEKYYHIEAEETSPQEVMEELFKEDPDTAISIFENYITEKGNSDKLDLCCMTLAKEKYIFAVRFDFGNAGTTYQLARAKSFEENGEWGYISDSFVEKMEERGFEYLADGAFRTEETDEEARESLTELADYSEDLQDFIIQSGNYVKLSLEAKEKEEVETKADIIEEEDEDEVYEFFGMKLGGPVERR